ncbi:MAG: prepilin-type N-terminal cleavage/methylation domain-containing protein [Armatimonadetes bacterium]|nr:prepilin-type N-terminal cleavage/methylation domain-containing protein [Armatimonadota bacterium]
MKHTRGFTLISILTVIAVIGILGGIVYVGFGSPAAGDGTGRPDGRGSTTLGGAVARTRDYECTQRIGQVRLAIQMQLIDDIVPESLADLNLPASMLKCPLGEEAYEYSPENQKVTCPHPGHGNH